MDNTKENKKNFNEVFWFFGDEFQVVVIFLRRGAFKKGKNIQMFGAKPMNSIVFFVK